MLVSWRDDLGNVLATSSSLDITLAVGGHTLIFHADDGLNSSDAVVHVGVLPSADIGVTAALTDPAAIVP